MENNISLYEIHFTERDEEARRLETVRSEIEAELDAAMKEFAKISRRKRLGKKSRRRITPLLKEGKGRLY